MPNRDYVSTHDHLLRYVPTTKNLDYNLDDRGIQSTVDSPSFRPILYPFSSRLFLEVPDFGNSWWTETESGGGRNYCATVYLLDYGKRNSTCFWTATWTSSTFCPGPSSDSSTSDDRTSGGTTQSVTSTLVRLWVSDLYRRGRTDDRFIGHLWTEKRTPVVIGLWETPSLNSFTSRF